MALNRARIADIGFSALEGAESMKLHAYSAFTLLFMVRGTADIKTVRKHLAVRAHETGLIAKNTWESYVKGVETASDMFQSNLATDADYLAIFNMAEDEAVDAVRQLYEGLNILSGSDIRAWATAGEFVPLDKEAAKAAKAAKAKEAALAKNSSAAALFFASKPADTATISDMASSPVVSPLEAILQAIGALNTADAATAMAAINDRMVALQALVDANPTPAHPVAPVLADDVVVAKLSTLGRVKHAA